MVPSPVPRVLLFAPLAVALALPLPARAQDVAPADSVEVTAAKAEVDRLRKELELAYVDVQRDHGRVRAQEWGAATWDAAFKSFLETFVADARTAGTTASAADIAATAVATLEARKVDVPLTRTSLLVVLADTSRDAVADARAAAPELFFTAARRVFSEEKVEDAWDEHFLVLPAVQAFRVARAKLAAARTPPPPEEGPVTPAQAPGDPLDQLVFLDKGKPWLGPWTGWTSDIGEKQNKRQQRAVKAVWIERHEVTCAQYRDFVQALAPSARRAMLPQGWTADEKDDAVLPAGKERHPVAGVTWRQAHAYAEHMGMRLPTCDEWERAAAGGDKDARTYPWGNIEEGRRWAHLGTEPKDTVPVDAFPDDATPDGVIGMAGNVAELVATYPDRTDIARTGPEKNRQVLVCGGSFSSRASECASSWRWVVDEGAASPTVGFRCVMDEAEYKKRRR